MDNLISFDMQNKESVSKRMKHKPLIWYSIMLVYRYFISSFWFSQAQFIQMQGISAFLSSTMLTFTHHMLDALLRKKTFQTHMYANMDTKD